eukprot:CAMPEP_0117680152 /NCGR_PEP_ID=MMETSP0804-20121206/18191_1 /TAXON_ID=1074897 /ORGANISM="Tetraselmis astigmatica, Strain CCMP880" /LENGTH=75 /DNA_ID=CAMNT_0005489613 /DNA_START=1526 /DNA_END=1753 /DNA_ORIENTATION=+
MKTLSGRCGKLWPTGSGFPWPLPGESEHDKLRMQYSRGTSGLTPWACAAIGEPAWTPPFSWDLSSRVKDISTEGW